MEFGWFLVEEIADFFMPLK